MDILGYIRDGDFDLEASEGFYKVCGQSEIHVNGHLSINTGLRIHPPAGTAIIIQPSAESADKGLRVYASWVAGSPLFLLMESPTPVILPEGAVAAHVRVVKTAFPRLVQWTEENVKERALASSELKKVTLPQKAPFSLPKPISVMGAQRQYN